MPVTSDIVDSWRRPRVVVRRLLDRPGSESFLLTFLLTFLMLAFVASAPNLARQAFIDPSTPLLQRMYGAGLGLLATIPLWYLVAGLVHLVARVVGGRGTFYGARLALFWALVVISPAMLMHGLVLGLQGPGGFANGFGMLVALGFLAYWMIMLREVER